MPEERAIHERMSRRLPLAFSYPEVGASRTQAFPPGYRIDQHAICVGQGAECYERAKAALQRWEMFNVHWVKLHPELPAVAVDTNVAISARYLGIWKVNLCRIAYLLQDDGEIRRYGFALGTLSDHVLAGEELFCVEWHRADDSVWYSVAAFSRPNSGLSRVGYPLVRQLQKRFAADSRTAMARACTGGGPFPA